MSMAKEYKVVLCGKFGVGRTTFATRLRSAKSDAKVIKALKATQYPTNLNTSAGAVSLTMYDTTLHAKGGLPDNGFFRMADAAVLFFDLTDSESYEALDEWYEALQKSNGRKGSEPLPIIVVGSKADDIKNRALKPEQIEFARKKGYTYREISAKANYGIKDLYLEICKGLLGDGVQFTDNVDLANPEIKEIDEDALDKLYQEYEKAGSA